MYYSGVLCSKWLVSSSVIHSLLGFPTAYSKPTYPPTCSIYNTVCIFVVWSNFFFPCSISGSSEIRIHLLHWLIFFFLGPSLQTNFIEGRLHSLAALGAYTLPASGARHFFLLIREDKAGARVRVQEQTGQFAEGWRDKNVYNQQSRLLTLETTPLGIKSCCLCC